MFHCAEQMQSLILQGCFHIDHLKRESFCVVTLNQFNTGFFDVTISLEAGANHGPICNLHQCDDVETS